MPLDLEQKRLYSRHLLLAELGARGQERLLETRAHVERGADAQAAEVARDYLVRAGVEVTSDGALAVDVPTPTAVARLAGDPLLRGAAGVLAGAFAAVEAIKTAAGVGSAARLPEDLTLAGAVP